MLLINPHLAWGERFYRYMEVHLSAPDYDLYGAPQIGFPVPVVGFNRRAGWGRTVNTIDTVDFYRLALREDGYEFDGKVMPFEQRTKVLKVKQPDGSFHDVTLNIRETVHGPVVFDSQGLTLAMRVAGLDRPKMLEQWFRMGEAQNLEKFSRHCDSWRYRCGMPAKRILMVTSCSCSTAWCPSVALAIGHIGRRSCRVIRRRRYGLSFLRRIA